MRAGTWLMVWACCVSHAGAQQPADGISTTVDDCVPIDRKEFERLLAIELGTALEHAEDAARVSLQCVASGVELRVDDAVTRKAMTRVISLERLPVSSRSRLLALAVVELLTASWLELHLLGEPPVEPVGPPPSKDSVTRARRVVQERAGTPESEAESEMSTLRLSIAFELAMFSSEPQLIPCLGLRMTYAFSNTFAMLAAAQLGKASLPASLALGSGSEQVEVDLTAASLLLGMLYQARVSVFDWFGGVGARVGLVFVRGSPVDDPELAPRGSSAPWVAPAVVFGLDYRFAAHLRLALGLELGPVVVYPVVKVEGEQQPLLELKDFWASASLGLAWSN